MKQTSMIAGCRPKVLTYFFYAVSLCEVTKSIKIFVMSTAIVLFAFMTSLQIDLIDLQKIKTMNSNGFNIMQGLIREVLMGIFAEVEDSFDDCR
jgi:hypothetical protein